MNNDLNLGVVQLGKSKAHLSVEDSGEGKIAED